MRPEQAANERTIQIWVCDVCKTSKFEDFLEACRHEEICMNGGAEKQEELSNTVISPSGDAAKGTSKKKSVHEFFACTQRKPEASIASADDPKLMPSILINSTKGNIAAKKRKNHRAPIASNFDPVDSDTSDKPKKHKKDVCHSDPKTKTACPIVDLPQSSIGGLSTGSLTDSSLAAIFGTTKLSAIHAEQRAVELIAKRRLADLAQQKKRTLNIAPMKDNARQHPKRPNPDRFPVPSHVGAPLASTLFPVDSDTSDKPKKCKKNDSYSDPKAKTACPLVVLPQSNKGGQSTESLTDSAFAAIFGTAKLSAIQAQQPAVELTAKRRLADKAQQKNRTVTLAPKKDSARQHPKRPNPDRFPVPSHVGATNGEDGHTSKYGDVLSVLRKTLKHRSTNDQQSDAVAPYRHIQVPAIPSAVDINFRMLSSAIVVPKAIDLEDHELWSRKYTIRNIPSDVCGATNKRVAESCTGFVDEWKVERQKALVRRADKQDRLARGKKMRSKKKKVDDLWDDASDDNQSGLPSICLLTGPVGCGKTSLVHSIARSCDCEVMEINTTDKRSHQNLKNAIEEMTQSDSTLDMLKNRAAAPLIFSKRQSALVDSEDEDSDEEGSAVPIVLIDEVDLIFDHDGDAGFWPALKALAKRAKCPIFLTANAIPQAMSALSMRFKHYSMERPTPTECMRKILQVMNSENLAYRQNLLRDQVEQVLVVFAERYECDLRRILLEMQLFAKARNYVALSEPDQSFLDKASMNPGIRFFEEGPVARKITPNAVPAEEQTRLTIEGRGFASLPQNCSISIGQQVCEAEVVDDTTISAVCPPFPLQETNFRYSCRFPVVKIEAPPAISRSAIGTRLNTLELHEGSTMLAASHVTIEYLLPCRSRDKSVKRKSMVHSKHTEEPSSVRQSETKMLIENPTTVEVHMNAVSDEDLQSLEELSQLAYKLERHSDATFMEHSMYGIPWLGGASRGFASHFVDGFGTSCDPTATNKLCRDDNAKPPPIARILLCGWNDDDCFFGDSDAYVTKPGFRDRELYSQMARSGRRGSVSTSIISSDAEDADDQGQENIQTKHFPCQSDEDAFLVRETLLAELPSTLTNLLGDSPGWGQLTNKLTYKRRKHNMRMTNEFFSELWHDLNACQIFARGVGRDVEAEESFDARIFLDYGPIISQICLYEAAAISLADSSVDDVQSLSRRTTRRSKELMHAHHLMKVNQGLYEEDCREMGRNRAALLLLY